MPADGSGAGGDREATSIHRAEWPYGVSDPELPVISHSITTIQLNNIQSQVIRVRAYNQQSIDSNRSTRQHTLESHRSEGLQSTVIRLQPFDCTSYCQRSFEAAWPLDCY